MELEFALEAIQTDEAYPFLVESSPASDLRPLAAAASAPAAPTSDLRPPPSDPRSTAALTVNWAPLVAQIIAEVKGGAAPGPISARFHNTLAEVMVEVARRAGQERVVLSGGCFQNRYLAERAVRRLATEGFRPYWHQRVPPNDGGIALGQVVAALGGWR
jgi:hydrogenase maturation protein HypF